MKKILLKELTDIYLGVTHTPNYVSSGVPFLSVKDISGGQICFDDCKYISEEEYNSLSRGAKPQVGDMLFCRVGTIGKPIIIPNGTPKFGSFVSLGYLRNKDSSRCRMDYLRHWMNSKSFYDQVQSNVKGASQVNLNTGWLSKFEVPLPEYSVQSDIVAILDLCERVIDKRNIELQILDNLIKARFVEMFVGKNYPLITVDELSNGKGEYGAQSASVEYDPTRPRYVRITDINDDGSLNDDYVSSSDVRDDEQYKLNYGDFLFARMGATVGKTYAYKCGNQIYAGYLIRYKLNLKKVVPEYLYVYTQLDEYWNWVKLNQSGAAQPGINAKKFGSLQVPIAPLLEQQVFQSFVKQVDKSKFSGMKGNALFM